MEEYVGKLWDRLITRSASRAYGAAGVTFECIQKPAGILFRALGGDAGLRLVAGTARAHGARRAWLARLAGSDRVLPVAVRNGETLSLPARIDYFPTSKLNRDLYLWLAALAAGAESWEGGVFQCNQRLTQQLLARFPGLVSRYRRLLAAHLPGRPNPDALSPNEARQELAIRAALLNPGSVAVLPWAKRPPWPVPLWLMPPLATEPQTTHEQTGEDSPGHTRTPKENRRLAAQRVAAPKKDGGLLLYRFESLFSWAEYVQVDRATEEGDDEDAERAAEDMAVLSVTRDTSTTATRVRLDLDLPPEGEHEIKIAGDLLLPEWDYRKQALLPDHCRVESLSAVQTTDTQLPLALRASARRVRRQFAALAAGRRWLKGQEQGEDLDLDACLRQRAQRLARYPAASHGLYRAQFKRERDLACLLLADLSLSTDTWVNDERRVIDVLRDSLFLFSEALAASGDAFALYGFSSRRREHVRIHTLKEFSENYGDRVRGRINAIRPGFYTRMGAAIRRATLLLAERPARQRLLLLLTDGKPNDLDLYEGRYGVEDTRHAVIAARRAGMQVFCITIDEGPGDYLPHLFGDGHYIVVRQASELPNKLTRLYVRLTA